MISEINELSAPRFILNIFSTVSRQLTRSPWVVIPLAVSSISLILIKIFFRHHHHYIPIFPPCEDISLPLERCLVDCARQLFNRKGILQNKKQFIKLCKQAGLKLAEQDTGKKTAETIFNRLKKIGPPPSANDDLLTLTAHLSPILQLLKYVVIKQKISQVEVQEAFQWTFNLDTQQFIK